MSNAHSLLSNDSTPCFFMIRSVHQKKTSVSTVWIGVSLFNIQTYCRVHTVNETDFCFHGMVSISKFKNIIFKYKLFICWKSSVYHKNKILFIVHTNQILSKSNKTIIIIIITMQSFEKILFKRVLTVVIDPL